ncbi:hypothetical protein CIK05_04140 [Bdellovibrio sp. qaytius]|nr:hypothetical protein CIK05_04140 [Bdellovibrio sp. qaytius]
MKNLKCFAGDIDPLKLDRTPFGLNHKLADHPALAIENLAKVISDFPKEKILHSKELNNLSKNFDTEMDSTNHEVNLVEVIENIRTSKSYIAIKNPELHPSFKDLYKDLTEDISNLLQAHGTGTKPLEPKLWVFIASPGAITPFHFDRTSNIIMQIRGSKELAVFPPRVDEIISQRDTEGYVDWSTELPPWREELDLFAHKFNFKKGEAIHIPFVSGHYVKNGTDDISISLSFFFHSDETLRWSNAMKFNNRIRRFGVSPNPVGIKQGLDKIKAKAFPLVHRMMSLMRGLK